MFSEVRLATISVTDLERSERFYRDGFGYVMKGEGSLSADDDGGRVGDAWRMPQGLTARYVVVGPAHAESSLLRIVEFDAEGEAIWGDVPAGKVIGLYALNMRVPEIESGWKRLVAAGGTVKSEPTFWEVTNGTAWDSQIYDPDGVLIDAWSIAGPIADTLGPAIDPASEIQTVALHVADAVRSKEFYVGLGFGVLYDQKVAGLEQFFGVPEGVVMHNVNLMMDHPPTGRIEASQYIDYAGISISDRTRPPNRGMLSASFEVNDLEAASGQIARLGAEATADVATMAVAPFGSIRIATFLGPDGEPLELFERV